MAISSRFLATTALVLVALSSAGLAVAADRGAETGNDGSDQVTQSWLAKLGADLSAVAAPTYDLANAGRDTIGNLQGLNFEAMNLAIDQGDMAIGEVNEALLELSADKAQSPAELNGVNLGFDTVARIDAISHAQAAASGLDHSWAVLRVRATVIAELIGDLQHHDDLVFQATAAGRGSDWSAALDALDSAAKALDDARAARDRLGTAATTDTLDELITRFADYDASLRALYSYVETNGAGPSAEFDALSKAVADKPEGVTDQQRRLFSHRW